MLTKTKKWLTVFIVAIAALLLVACDKKPKEVNPTAIQITFDFYEIENGVEINGEKVLLSVDTTPSNAIKTVNWSSSDDKIATVNDNGEVTGLKPGKVKIKATSTVDESLFHEIELTVYENKNPNIVLINARDEVKADWTTFITKDHQFPKVTNPYVKVEYFDVDGNKFNNNVYRYRYEKDALESIIVKLSYLESVLEFPMDIKIVQDAEHNEFLAVDAAIAKLAAHFKPFDNAKVYENLDLPAEYTVEDYDIVITYTTDTKEVIAADGTYVRPNDDTPVKIVAYFVCGNVSGTYTKVFNANGYTQAEKVAWLKENVLKFDPELAGKNLALPLFDNKFGTKIEWATDNADVLTAAGKINPFITEATDVKMTATITYPGTLDATFEFTETAEFTIKVLPFGNDAQAAAFQFGEMMLNSEAFPFHFPYGAPNRDGGNKFPLPFVYGGDSEYKDVAISWESKEAGIFNDAWELQKQFLRYHEVTLVYTLQVGDDVASGELTINVGIAEIANVYYFGGIFGKTPGPSTQPYDLLNTFSQDDNAGTATSLKFSGHTFYYDEKDEAGNLIKRYQYFSTSKQTHVIKEGEKLSINEDGTINGKVPSMTGDLVASYQYILLVNDTAKDVKIPIVYLNYKGSKVTHDMNENPMIRQTAIAYDGWRIGFATDATGKVVFGFGETAIEPAFDAKLAEDANFEYPEYITIPAGGIGWSPFTNQNLAAIGKWFCEVGNQFVMQKYTPKY